MDFLSAITYGVEKAVFASSYPFNQVKSRWWSRGEVSLKEANWKSLECSSMHIIYRCARLGVCVCVCWSARDCAYACLSVGVLWQASTCACVQFVDSWSENVTARKYFYNLRLLSSIEQAITRILNVCQSWQCDTWL